jgi:hypothetical protein
MKSLFVTVTIAAAMMASPASAAKPMACTGENIGKSVTAASSMPDSPKKMAMMKEMAAANTAMSKGDMRGACKSYMKAQKMAASK